MNPATPQHSNELHFLIKSLNYLRTHWWLFLCELIALQILPLYMYSKKAPVYESSGSVLIDTSRRMAYQSVVSGPNFYDWSGGSRKANITLLLTGQEVMERFRIALVESYNNEGRPLPLRSLFPAGVSLPAVLLKTKITLTSDRTSDIYYIQCRGENPDVPFNLCSIYMGIVAVSYASPHVMGKGTNKCISITIFL